MRIFWRRGFRLLRLVTLGALGNIIGHGSALRLIIEIRDQLKSCRVGSCNAALRYLIIIFRDPFFLLIRFQTSYCQPLIRNIRSFTCQILRPDRNDLPKLTELFNQIGQFSVIVRTLNLLFQFFNFMLFFSEITVIDLDPHLFPGFFPVFAAAIAFINVFQQRITFFNHVLLLRFSRNSG